MVAIIVSCITALGTAGLGVIGRQRVITNGTKLSGLEGKIQELEVEIRSLRYQLAQCHEERTEDLQRYEQRELELLRRLSALEGGG